MIRFHVTNEIFELTKTGQKKHEYRDFTGYWKSRLSKINESTDAEIIRGYTKDVLSIRILDVSVIPIDAIDVPSYRSFIKTMHCYDVEFELV